MHSGGSDKSTADGSIKKILFRFCLLLLLLTAMQTKKEINILQLTIALFDRQIKEKKVAKAFYLFFVPFCPHMEFFEESSWQMEPLLDCIKGRIV